MKTQQFKRRGIAIVWDGDSSDVDGDVTVRAVLVSPAQSITEKRFNELLHLSGGLPFVALTPNRVDAFRLGKMSGRRRVHSNGDLQHACVSVEAREGVHSGISVADRVQTLKVLGESEPDSRRLVSPGHIFPIEVRSGGVLVRNALPEAALDLVRIASYPDAAVFMDLLDEKCEHSADGSELRLSEVEALGEKHAIPIVALHDLVRYRLENETLVERIAETWLPTRLAGELKSYIYRSKVHEGEHLLLVKGKVSPEHPVLVRVQTEFTFGDVFGGSNPPSRQQLDRSLELISESHAGVLLYLRRPGAGTLAAQVASWEEQYSSRSPAMMREYGLGAQILRDIGVSKIDLLTNSTRALVGIKTFGIEIVSTRQVH